MTADNHIRHVAVVGASGRSGEHMTAELLKTGKHVVTAITRPESTKQFPDAVKVVRVGYDDHAGLVTAFQGQDALVITLAALASKDISIKLVEAAIEAGVPWILPNEWGSDYTDAQVNEDVGLGADRLQIRSLIKSKGGDKTSYVAVACGFWYDFSLGSGPEAFGFDFPKKQLTYFDDGQFKMKYSTLPYNGQTVAKLLSLPIQPKDSNDEGPTLSEYKNGIVRIHTFEADQHDMLASVLRVTGDKESDWKISQESSKDRFEAGKKRVSGGDLSGWRQLLYARMFYPDRPAYGSEYEDERLGLKKEDLDEATKWAIGQVGVPLFR